MKKQNYCYLFSCIFLLIGCGSNTKISNCKTSLIGKWKSKHEKLTIDANTIIFKSRKYTDTVYYYLTEDTINILPIDSINIFPTDSCEQLLVLFPTLKDMKQNLNIQDIAYIYNANNIFTLWYYGRPIEQIINYKKK